MKTAEEILEMRIKSLESKLKISQREQKRLKQEKAKLKKENEEKKRKLAQEPIIKMKDFQKIEERIRLVKKQLEKKEKENHNLRDICQKQENELNILRNSINEKYEDDDVSSILYKLSTYKAENVKLGNEMNSKDLQIKKMEQELIQIKEDEASMEDNYQMLNQENLELREEIEQLKEEIMESSEEMKILADQVEEKNVQRQDFDNIQKELERYKGIENEIKRVIEAKQKTEEKYNRLEKINAKQSIKLKEIKVLKDALEEMKIENQRVSEDRMKMFEDYDNKVKQLDQFAKMNNELRVSSEKAQTDMKLFFNKMKEVNYKNNKLIKYLRKLREREKNTRITCEETLKKNNKAVLEMKKETETLRKEKEEMESQTNKMKTEITNSQTSKTQEKKKVKELEEKNLKMRKTFEEKIKIEKEKVFSLEKEKEKLKKSFAKDKDRLKKDLEKSKKECRNLKLLFDTKNSLEISRRESRANTIQTKRLKNIPKLDDKFLLQLSKIKNQSFHSTRSNPNNVLLQKEEDNNYFTRRKRNYILQNSVLEN